MKRQRLRGHEDARRARPVEQPAREEERPGALRHDAERVEPHHDDLQGQTDEQRAPSAEAVGQDADERAGDDPHRAVRREDDADEGEREAEAQPDDGQDGESHAAGHPREEGGERSVGREGAGGMGRPVFVGAIVARR